MPGRQRYTARQVADALREGDGFIVDAARILGCSRRTVERYIQRYEVCREARRVAFANFVDFAEKTLREKIREGNLTALIFFLKTKAGYIERHEVTGEGGGALQVKMYVGWTPDNWDATHGNRVNG